MIHSIKGAIFDMDGTLVDSLFLWDVIWDVFGKRYRGEGFRPSEEDDKAVRTMLLQTAMDYIHERYSFGKNGQELLDVVNEIIEDFYCNRVELKKGVREFLEYCKGNGIPMCIASASQPHSIRAAVRHCGIEHYFSAILSCSEIGKGKEEPDIYLLAAKTLGTKVGETCVFEDSLTALVTARNAGMKTVGIYDKYNYGWETIPTVADVSIAEGETLKKLIPATD